MFNLNGDYKQEFIEIVDLKVLEIESAYKLDGTLPSREERKQWVDDITSMYIEDTGEVPPNYYLEKLANLILFEEIHDPRKNKMRLENYPIASDLQIKRRHNNETGFGIAEDRYNSDKKNMSRPKRNLKFE
jgi:hypothetical protein